MKNAAVNTAKVLQKFPLAIITAFELLYKYTRASDIQWQIKASQFQ